MDKPFTGKVIEELLPGVLAWLSGKPLRRIETALGGDPKFDSACPRARRLATGIVPMGLTFIMGLVARTAQEVPEILSGDVSPRYVIDALSTAVRRGFDSPSKLAFAEVRKGLLTRVQFHQAFVEEVGQEMEMDSTDDYGSLVLKMRRHLS